MGNFLVRFIYFALVFRTLPVWGQQTPLHSLIFKDPYRLVPAYAGIKGTLFASTIYRNQWQNLDRHPQSIDLAIHFPEYRYKTGIGIHAGQDKIGLQQTVFIKPGLNKVFQNKLGLLSIGIQGELYLSNFVSSDARTPEGDYNNGTIDHKDDHLSNFNGRIAIYDAGLSAYFQMDQFEIGITLEKIFGTKQDNKVFPWANNRTLKGLALYHFNWLKFDFEEQLVILSDLKSHQLSFYSGFEYNGNIFAGIHLRGYNGNSLESFGVSFGFSLSKNLQMAYCNEFFIGRIPGRSIGNSQELGFFYNFGRPIGGGKAPRILHSPRYSD